MTSCSFYAQPLALHLWTIRWPNFISSEASLANFLSSDEVARAHQYRVEQPKQAFITVRALLRKTLSLYVNEDPKKIEIHYQSSGKPFIHQNIFFNISHSHDLALIVIADQPIGVDIERMKSDFNSKIAKKYFETKEYNELMQLKSEKQIEKFYQLWTEKEALIKALGKSIFQPLRAYHVETKNNLKSASFYIDEKRYIFYIKNMMIDPVFKASIAFQNEINEINYFHWDTLLNPIFDRIEKWS